MICCGMAVKRCDCEEGEGMTVNMEIETLIDKGR